MAGVLRDGPSKKFKSLPNKSEDTKTDSLDGALTTENQACTAELDLQRNEKQSRSEAAGKRKAGQNVKKPKRRLTQILRLPLFNTPDDEVDPSTKTGNSNASRFATKGRESEIAPQTNTKQGRVRGTSLSEADSTAQDNADMDAPIGTKLQEGVGLKLNVFDIGNVQEGGEGQSIKTSMVNEVASYEERRMSSSLSKAVLTSGTNYTGQDSKTMHASYQECTVNAKFSKRPSSSTVATNSSEYSRRGRDLSKESGTVATADINEDASASIVQAPSSLTSLDEEKKLLLGLSKRSDHGKVRSNRVDKRQYAESFCVGGLLGSTTEDISSRICKQKTTVETSLIQKSENCHLKKPEPQESVVGTAKTSSLEVEKYSESVNNAHLQRNDASFSAREEVRQKLCEDACLDFSENRNELQLMERKSPTSNVPKGSKQTHVVEYFSEVPLKEDKVSSQIVQDHHSFKEGCPEICPPETTLGTAEGETWRMDEITKMLEQYENTETNVRFAEKQSDVAANFAKVIGTKDYHDMDHFESADSTDVKRSYVNKHMDIEKRINCAEELHVSAVISTKTTHPEETADVCHIITATSADEKKHCSRSTATENTFAEGDDSKDIFRANVTSKVIEAKKTNSMVQHTCMSKSDEICHTVCTVTASIKKNNNKKRKSANTTLSSVEKPHVSLTKYKKSINDPKADTLQSCIAPDTCKHNVGKDDSAEEATKEVAEICNFAIAVSRKPSKDCADNNDSNENGCDGKDASVLLGMATNSAKKKYGQQTDEVHQAANRQPPRLNYSLDAKNDVNDNDSAFTFLSIAEKMHTSTKKPAKATDDYALNRVSGLSPKVKDDSAEEHGSAKIEASSPEMLPALKKELARATHANIAGALIKTTSSASANATDNVEHDGVETKMNFKKKPYDLGRSAKAIQSKKADHTYNFTNAASVHSKCDFEKDHRVDVKNSKTELLPASIKKSATATDTKEAGHLHNSTSATSTDAKNTVEEHDSFAKQTGSDVLLPVLIKRSAKAKEQEEAIHVHEFASTASSEAKVGAEEYGSGKTRTSSSEMPPGRDPDKAKNAKEADHVYDIASSSSALVKSAYAKGLVSAKTRNSLEKTASAKGAGYVRKFTNSPSFGTKYCAQEHALDDTKNGSVEMPFASTRKLEKEEDAKKADDVHGYTSATSANAGDSTEKHDSFATKTSSQPNSTRLQLASAKKPEKTKDAKRVTHLPDSTSSASFDVKYNVKEHDSVETKTSSRDAKHKKEASYVHDSRSSPSASVGSGYAEKRDSAETKISSDKMSPPFMNKPEKAKKSKEVGYVDNATNPVSLDAKHNARESNSIKTQISLEKSNDAMKTSHFYDLTSLASSDAKDNAEQHDIFATKTSSDVMFFALMKKSVQLKDQEEADHAHGSTSAASAGSKCDEEEDHKFEMKTGTAKVHPSSTKKPEKAKIARETCHVYDSTSAASSNTKDSAEEHDSFVTKASWDEMLTALMMNSAEVKNQDESDHVHEFTGATSSDAKNFVVEHNGAETKTSFGEIPSAPPKKYGNTVHSSTNATSVNSKYYSEEDHSTEMQSSFVGPGLSSSSKTIDAKEVDHAHELIRDCSAMLENDHAEEHDSVKPKTNSSKVPTTPVRKPFNASHATEVNALLHTANSALAKTESAKKDCRAKMNASLAGTSITSKEKSDRATFAKEEDKSLESISVLFETLRNDHAEQLYSLETNTSFVELQPALGKKSAKAKNAKKANALSLTAITAITNTEDSVEEHYGAKTKTMSDNMQSGSTKETEKTTDAKEADFVHDFYKSTATLDTKDVTEEHDSKMTKASSVRVVPTPMKKATKATHAKETDALDCAASTTSTDANDSVEQDDDAKTRLSSIKMPPATMEKLAKMIKAEKAADLHESTSNPSFSMENDYAKENDSAENFFCSAKAPQSPIKELARSTKGQKTYNDLYSRSAPPADARKNMEMQKNKVDGTSSAGVHRALANKSAGSTDAEEANLVHDFICTVPAKSKANSVGISDSAKSSYAETPTSWAEESEIASDLRKSEDFLNSSCTALAETIINCVQDRSSNVIQCSFGNSSFPKKKRTDESPPNKEPAVLHTDFSTDSVDVNLLITSGYESSKNRTSCDDVIPCCLNRSTTFKKCREKSTSNHSGSSCSNSPLLENKEHLLRECDDSKFENESHAIINERSGSNHRESSHQSGNEDVKNRVKKQQDKVSMPLDKPQKTTKKHVDFQRVNIERDERKTPTGKIPSTSNEPLINQNQAKESSMSPEASSPFINYCEAQRGMDTQKNVRKKEDDELARRTTSNGQTKLSVHMNEVDLKRCSDLPTFAVDVKQRQHIVEEDNTVIRSVLKEKMKNQELPASTTETDAISFTVHSARGRDAMFDKEDDMFSKKTLEPEMRAEPHDSSFGEQAVKSVNSQNFKASRLEQSKYEQESRRLICDIDSSKEKDKPLNKLESKSGLASAKEVVDVCEREREEITSYLSALKENHHGKLRRSKDTVRVSNEENEASKQCFVFERYDQDKEESQEAERMLAGSDEEHAMERTSESDETNAEEQSKPGTERTTAKMLELNREPLEVSEELRCVAEESYAVEDKLTETSTPPFFASNKAKKAPIRDNIPKKKKETAITSKKLEESRSDGNQSHLLVEKMKQNPLCGKGMGNNAGSLYESDGATKSDPLPKSLNEPPVSGMSHDLVKKLDEHTSASADKAEVELIGKEKKNGEEHLGRRKSTRRESTRNANETSACEARTLTDHDSKVNEADRKGKEAAVAKIVSEVHLYNLKTRADEVTSTLVGDRVKTAQGDESAKRKEANENNRTLSEKLLIEKKSQSSIKDLQRIRSAALLSDLHPLGGEKAVPQDDDEKLNLKVDSPLDRGKKMNKPTKRHDDDFSAAKANDNKEVAEYRDGQNVEMAKNQFCSEESTDKSQLSKLSACGLLPTLSVDETEYVTALTKGAVLEKKGTASARTNLRASETVSDYVQDIGTVLNPTNEEEGNSDGAKCPSEVLVSELRQAVNAALPEQSARDAPQSETLPFDNGSQQASVETMHEGCCDADLVSPKHHGKKNSAALRPVNSAAECSRPKDLEKSESSVLCKVNIDYSSDHFSSCTEDEAAVGFCIPIANSMKMEFNIVCGSSGTHSEQIFPIAEKTPTPPSASVKASAPRKQAKKPKSYLSKETEKLLKRKAKLMEQQKDTKEAEPQSEFASGKKTIHDDYGDQSTDVMTDPTTDSDYTMEALAEAGKKGVEDSWELHTTHQQLHKQDEGAVERDHNARAPSFLHKRQTLKCVEGKSLAVTVFLTAAPQPKITVYHNSEQVICANQVEPVRTPEQNLYSFAFTIDRVQLEDSGKIMFRAENHWGFDECLTHMEITDQVKPKFSKFDTNTLFEREFEAAEVIWSVTDVTVPEGGTAWLYGKLCGYPVPVLIWMKNGVEIDTNHPEGKYSAELKSDGTFSLEISNCVIDDDDIYELLVENMAGVDSCLFRINVDGKGDDQDRRSRRKQHVLKNVDHHKNECSTDSEFDNPKKKKRRRIRRVVEKTNPNAPRLTQLIAPRFNKALDDLDVRAGENVVMMVVMQGNPPPDVHFYRDGMLLANDDKYEIRQELDHHYLVVKSTEEQEEAEYACQAVNIAGEAWCYSELLVRSSLPGTKEKEEGLSAEKSGSKLTKTDESQMSISKKDKTEEIQKVTEQLQECKHLEKSEASKEKKTGKKSETSAKIAKDSFVQSELPLTEQHRAEAVCTTNATEDHDYKEDLHGEKQERAENFFSTQSGGSSVLHSLPSPREKKEQTREQKETPSTITRAEKESMGSTAAAHAVAADKAVDANAAAGITKDEPNAQSAKKKRKIPKALVIPFEISSRFGDPSILHSEASLTANLTAREGAAEVVSPIVKPRSASISMNVASPYSRDARTITPQKISADFTFKRPVQSYSQEICIEYTAETKGEEKMHAVGDHKSAFGGRESISFDFREKTNQSQITETVKVEVDECISGEQRDISPLRTTEESTAREKTSSSADLSFPRKKTHNIPKLTKKSKSQIADSANRATSIVTVEDVSPSAGLKEISEAPVEKHLKTGQDEANIKGPAGKGHALHDCDLNTELSEGDTLSSRSKATTKVTAATEGGKESHETDSKMLDRTKCMMKTTLTSAKEEKETGPTEENSSVPNGNSEKFPEDLRGFAITSAKDQPEDTFKSTSRTRANSLDIEYRISDKSDRSKEETKNEELESASIGDGSLRKGQENAEEQSKDGIPIATVKEKLDAVFNSQIKHEEDIAVGKMEGEVVAKPEQKSKKTLDSKKRSCKTGTTRNSGADVKPEADGRTEIRSEEQETVVSCDAELKSTGVQKLSAVVSFPIEQDHRTNSTRLDESVILSISNSKKCKNGKAKNGKTVKVSDKERVISEEEKTAETALIPDGSTAALEVEVQPLNDLLKVKSSEKIKSSESSAEESLLSGKIGAKPMHTEDFFKSKQASVHNYTAGLGVSVEDGAAKIVKPLKRDVVHKKGDSVVLEMEVSHGTKEVNWYKDGKLIGSSHKFSPEVDGNICRLRLSDADYSDSGVYVVVAGSAQSSIRLAVLDVPHFKGKDETIVEVKRNENIAFSVPFECPGKPTVTCLKNGSRVDDHLTVQDSTVYFRKTSATVMDAGEYLVVVSNPLGNDQRKVTVRLTDVPKAPSNLTLNRTGKSTASISWDSQEDVDEYLIEMKEEHRRTFQKVAKISGAKTKYTIEDLKPSTNLTVRVTAANKQGLSESAEVRHVVREAPAMPPRIAEPPAVSEITRDGCVLTWSEPAEGGGSVAGGYDVFARKQSGEWEKLNREAVHGKRFVVKNLQQGVGYEFKVDAYNEEGMCSSSGVVSSPLLIPVLDLPGITPSVPKITVTGPDSVTIDWTTPNEESFPTFTVAYKSEGSEVWEEVHCDTNLCKVNGLKEEVSYIFKVAVRNEHGVGNFSKLSHPVKILPSSPPAVLKSIRDVTVPRKHQLRLECRFSGHPTPEHIWYKDGVEIDPKNSNTEIVNEGDNSVLFIHRVDTADDGLYMCRATNERGTAESTAKVTIGDVRCHFDTSFPEFNEAEAGEDVEFCCTMSDEHAVVSWYRDGKKLKKGTRFSFLVDGERRILKINGVESADSGVYRCETSDGRSRTEGELVVRDKESHIRLGPQDQNIQRFGEDITLACESTRPTSRVKWLKNGKEIWQQMNKYIVATEGCSSTLQILRFEKSDVGEYCAVLNGSEVSAPAHLTLQVGPSIEIREGIEDEVILNAHDELDLHIEITGEPAPAVRILHNGSPIKNRAVVQQYEDVVRMQMKNVLLADCGKIQIIAENANGTIRREFAVCVIDVPSAPVDLFVTSTGTDSATVSWKAPKEDHGSPVTGYIVQRRTLDSARWRTVGNTDAATLTFEASNLFSDQEYEFRVIAVNSVGQGLPSCHVEAVTKKDNDNMVEFPVGVPFKGIMLEAPSAPSVTADTGKMVLNWNVVEGASFYKVERSKRNGDWIEIAVIVENKYVDCTITDSDAYCYRVTAKTVDSTSEPSISSMPITVEETSDNNSSTFQQDAESEKNKDPTKKEATNNQEEVRSKDMQEGTSDEAPKPIKKKQLGGVDDILDTKQRLKKRKPRVVEQQFSVQQEAAHSQQQKPSLNNTTSNDCDYQLDPSKATTSTAETNSDDSLQVLSAFCSESSATREESPSLLIAKKTGIPTVTPLSPEIVVNACEPAKISVSVDGCDDVQCAWKKDGRPVVDDELFQTSFANGMAHLTICRTDQSTTGTYSLTAIGSDGSNTTDVKLCVRQVPHVPMDSLKVITDGGLCSLSWSEPVDDGNGVVGYVVEEYDEKLGEWSFVARTETNAFTADKRLPGSVQQFRVAAENNVGRGPFVESEKVKMIPEVPKLDISKPSVTLCGASMTAEWDPLPVGGVKYLVEIREAKAKRPWRLLSSEPVERNSFVIAGLSLGEKYTIRVTPTTSTSRGAPSEESDIFEYKETKENEKPAFLLKPEDTIIVKGAKVKLSTEFKGYPVPELHWLKNKKEIFSGQRIWIETDATSSALTVREMRENDEGDYSIVLRNAAGTSEHKFKLQMDALPEINRPDRYNSALIYDEGESVKLRLTFSGRPTPSVEWFDNGGNLIENTSKFKVENSAYNTVLTINSISTKDRGEYKLRVRNRCGVDSFSIGIQTTERPGPPGKPSVQDQNVDSVRLLWSAPTQDGGSPIRFYTVEMCTVSEGTWIKKEVTKHPFVTLFNLTPEETYVFRVRADNAFGQSDPSEESEPVYVKDVSRAVEEPVKRAVEDVEPEEIDYDRLDARVDYSEEKPIDIHHLPNDLQAKYVICEELGQGAYGTVYRAVEKATGKTWAAKMIQVRRGVKRDDVLHEILVMNQLNHEKLLHLHEAFDLGNEMCLIEEFVSGGELFEKIFEDESLMSEEEVRDYMYQILLGVQHMHKNQIVHLDLKPENILLKSKKSTDVKIIDFGLARKLDPKKSVKLLFGTPEFCAPEVVNYQPVGLSTDMWTVGVISYVLLSGLSPFLGDSDEDTLANVSAADWDFDDPSWDDVSDEAKDFICRLMVKDKRRRMTVQEALRHPWMTGPLLSAFNDLSEYIKKMQPSPTGRGPLPTRQKKNFMSLKRWSDDLLPIGRLAKRGAIFRRLTMDGVFERNISFETECAPSVKKRLEDIVAHVGDLIATLSCDIGGVPKPDITWFKDDKELLIPSSKYESRFKEGLAELTVKNVQESDAGRYSCRAVNELGSIATTSTLTVEERKVETKPVHSGHLERKSSTKIVATEEAALGSSPPIFHHLLTDCSVKIYQQKILCVTNTTLPEPEVEWFHNGELISRTNCGYLQKHDKGRFELTILKVAKHDEGEWKAVGTNSYGHCESSCSLIVEIPDGFVAPTFSQPLADLRIQEGGKMSFTVRVAAQPAPLITWYLDDKELHHSPHHRLQFDFEKGEYSLTVMDCGIRDTGEYKCLAKNVVGEAETACFASIFGRKVDIPRKVDRLKAPKFHMPLANPREIPEGAEMILTCVVSGIPTPSITWYKGNERVTGIDVRYVDGLCTLTIPNVSIQDAGTYICEAKNIHGSARSLSIVEVTPSPRKTFTAPKFVELLANRSIFENEEIILECSVFGKPTPTITWYKDGLKLMMENRMLHYTDRKGSTRLNIMKAKLHDSGEYTCEASNAFGKDFTHSTVQVNALPYIRTTPSTSCGPSRCASPLSTYLNEPRPPVITRPLTGATVTVGSRELLGLEVDGYPTPTVEWYHDGKLVAESRTLRTYFDGRVAFLKIYTAQIGHAGLYVCRVSNKFGTIESSAFLTVEEQLCPHVPNMPIFIQKLEDVTIDKLGQPVALNCRVYGDPHPVLCWLLNGRAIRNDPSFHCRETPNGSSSLEIAAVTEQLCGTYTVVASNSFGDAHSSATLRLERPEEKPDTFNQLLHIPLSVDSCQSEQYSR